MSVQIELALKGAEADIYFYASESGKKPIIDYLNSIQDTDRKKILALLKRFADYGEIRNEKQFRYEGDQIYAFKSGQCRILCFFIDGNKRKAVLLTYGFSKKQQKLPLNEKNKALKILQKLTMKK